MEKNLAKIKIKIMGAQGSGKTYISRLIAKSLQDEGLNVTGEDNDINTEYEIKPYKEYSEIEVLTEIEGI